MCELLLIRENACNEGTWNECIWISSEWSSMSHRVWGLTCRCFPLRGQRRIFSRPVSIPRCGVKNVANPLFYCVPSRWLSGIIPPTNDGSLQIVLKGEKMHAAIPFFLLNRRLFLTTLQNAQLDHLRVAFFKIFKWSTVILFLCYLLQNCHHKSRLVSLFIKADVI